MIATVIPLNTIARTHRVILIRFQQPESATLLQLTTLNFISTGYDVEKNNKKQDNPIEKADPIMDQDAWGAFVRNAVEELDVDPNFPDANYSSLSQDDHPGCVVQTGVNNTGNVGPTGFVVCSGKSVRRVLQVPN